MGTDDKSEQASFVKALRDLAAKHAAANPAAAEMRQLNQHLVAEARKRLHEQTRVLPFAGYLDETGAVTLVESKITDEKDATSELIGKLKASANERAIRAASVCVIVERPYPGGEKRIQFIQIQSEHRTGLALLSGVPADEAVVMQGVPGAAGPGVAVYAKKIAPAIFKG